MEKDFFPDLLCKDLTELSDQRTAKTTEARNMKFEL